MPKSYVASEPGAQRAAEHRFDPYAQLWSRLQAYWNLGHPIEKVEVIVLGGSWTSYPEGYRLWFVRRLFEAMNDFRDGPAARPGEPAHDRFAFESVGEQVDGSRGDRRYNDVLRDVLAASPASRPPAGGDRERQWRALEAEQRRNESARCRCVGLVLETRPDEIDVAEVAHLRRLGATKVQIGIQSLQDEVLARNRRGHDRRGDRGRR